MGQICKKTEQQKQDFSVKVIKNEKAYGDLTFKISTEKLNRVECDCLLIFTDHKLKVNKNKYLVLQSEKTAQKVQQFFDFQLSKQGLIMGKNLIFEMDLPNLSASYICVLCLGVWRGKDNVRQSLQVALAGAFERITQKGIQSVAITQIDEEYGIPVHSAYKSMTQAIHRCRNKLRLITYLCDSKHDQDQFQNAIKNYQQPVDSAYSVTSSYY